MRFLIIGGDAAGMSAASRAKRNDPDMEITVLEKTDDVSYSACGMPYNLADSHRAMDDLVVRPAHVFRDKQGINVLNGYTANGIDPSDKIVSGTDGDGEPFSLPYDKLLIATGASAIRPDVPGGRGEGVLVLKSLGDGRAIKQYIAEHNVRRAVILGMGYIGLETAEALRTRDITVTMIKPRPRFLPWMAEQLAEVVKQEVENHGVELLAGYSLKEIEGEPGQLTAVCEEQEVDTDMIISAIGVTPNSAEAESAGLALGPKKEITVNRRMETSAADIYSAGD